MKLAREGWGIVAATTALAVGATAFWGAAAWGIWVMWLLVLQFFRDPRRTINTVAANAILAPADGRVVFVGNTDSPLAPADKKIKISIFMNVFNVHANRVPSAGEVIYSKRFAGRFFNAALNKSSIHNERHLIGIKTTFGEVLCMQIAGLLARRVLCYAKVGETVSVGWRYGFIRFGSRVDVYLPPNCQSRVAIGDKVTAGVNVIAEAPSE